MPLCSECSTISLSTLCPSSGLSRADKKPIELRSNGSTLIQSAETCPMCAVLVGALLQDPHANAENIPLSLSTDPITAQVKLAPEGLTFPEPPGSEGARLTSFVVGAKHGESNKHLHGKVRLYSETREPSRRCDIIGRPPLAHPDDEDAFALMKKWVNACKDFHTTCSETLSGAVVNESTAPQLPSRVLCIEAARVRLLESNGKNGRYIALSYCWGKAGNRVPLRTTKDTSRHHMQEIPWDVLPKTYQDAITVARGMGYIYIWIDSLCIVQDDKDDWLRESRKMGAVYERADLTIAASHTHDSWQGFLSPRQLKNPRVELPNFFPGEGGPAVFATLRCETVADTFPEHGPLNRRAWATQEWLLSRRMLFFTSGTIMWSCKEISERETAERCYNISRNTRWKPIVETHSQRLLTFPTDKLIALEGLRVEMQRKSGYAYVHGVWMESLPDQLLWQVTRQGDDANAVDPLGLPTWTWAHVPVGVRFLVINGAKRFCESISLSTDSRVLTIRSLVKRMPVGEKSGREGSDARIAKLVETDIISSHARDTKFMAKRVFGENGDALGWVVYDSLVSSDGGGRDYCVPVMGSISYREARAERRLGAKISRKMRVHWVLVVRRHSDGMCSRVGVGKVYGREWWEDAQFEDVMLC